MMPKYKVALVTDSTCDLPHELRQQYEIFMVPLTVVWDGKDYRDGIDLEPTEFYKRLAVDPHLPTTSQPTPFEFTATFDAAIHHGAQEIVVVTISSAMSGTITSARHAAEKYNIPIHIVDSRSNSMSLGFQVLAAARARENGGGAAEMIAAADKARESMVYIIVLDTMKFLQRGGRIGAATAFLGEILQIKPQIRVNHTTGTVEAGEKTRTRTKALERLYQNFFEIVTVKGPLHIAVLHNNAEAEAMAILERIRTEFNPVETILTIVSPVLGVHTGPGAVAICGYSEG